MSKDTEMSDAQSSSSSRQSELPSFEYDPSVVSMISQPLASEKLTKKCYKLVRKASKARIVKRGVKEVCKSLRKGGKGIAIIAGNISPIDVITHLPPMCEENGVIYVFVPKKEDLGAAGGTKRPTSCVLIPRPEDAKLRKSYDELFQKVKDVQVVF